MSNPECELCHGNGFILDDAWDDYKSCPVCIPPDICDLPAKHLPRTEILDTARSLITGDRAATHGDAKASFEKIAAHWSIYLNTEVKARDVAQMMILLKAVRAKESPNHKDNPIDQAGYAGLYWEVL